MKDIINDLLDNGNKLPLVEDFYTIQGEGYHTGKPAYFIRLGGCDVGCRWCDAKYTWNPKQFPPVEIAEIINRAVSFPAHAIVITGGEPTQYPLEKLTEGLRSHGLEIFLETSGNCHIRGYIDWICLSPKKNSPPLEENLAKAHELKVIVESEDDFNWAEKNASKTSENCKLFLQPEWSRYETVVPVIVEYVKANPQWNISVQTHKFMRIP
ncbi:MAG: 7-carboxy-7-deazaguanine synthase QueE [Rikenellaceae bacterium]|nr:7-carboxy-7-deazaguanine synthase QueE [Rikenellaceae bacterium]